MYFISCHLITCSDLFASASEFYYPDSGPDLRKKKKQTNNLTVFHTIFLLFFFFTFAKNK